MKAVPVKVGEAPKAAETEEPMENQIAPRLTEALRNGETRVELHTRKILCCFFGFSNVRDGGI